MLKRNSVLLQDLIKNLSTKIKGHLFYQYGPTFATFSLYIHKIGNQYKTSITNLQDYQDQTPLHAYEMAESSYLLNDYFFLVSRDRMYFL